MRFSILLIGLEVLVFDFSLVPLALISVRIVLLARFIRCYWLGMIAPRFYRPTLGDIAISGVNVPPAIAFYLLYPIGLLIFAVNPALRSGSIGSATL